MVHAWWTLSVTFPVHGFPPFWVMNCCPVFYFLIVPLLLLDLLDWSSNCIVLFAIFCLLYWESNTGTLYHGATASHSSLLPRCPVIFLWESVSSLEVSGPSSLDFLLVWLLSTLGASF